VLIRLTGKLYVIYTWHLNDSLKSVLEQTIWTAILQGAKFSLNNYTLKSNNYVFFL